MPSHSQFLRGGRPKTECFARADGLHPNSVGTDDLQGFHQQVLTSEYVLEQVMSKKGNQLGCSTLLG